MSSMKDTSLFKNRYFWIIVIAFVLELLFFFVSPYLFESLTNIIVRLFITVTSYIVLLLSITVYFLFIRDEVQKRLADKREQKKRYKEYSSTIKGKVDDLKSVLPKRCGLSAMQVSIKVPNVQVTNYPGI